MPDLPTPAGARRPAYAPGSAPGSAPSPEPGPAPATARGPARPLIRRAARAARAPATLATLAWLGGCATAFAPATPELDARFGSATRQALAQQVLRPQAGAVAGDATPPFDGAAAVHMLTRHRESFKTPPTTFNVLGIGSGSGSGQP